MCFLQKDNTAAELLYALEAISEHGCYYPAGTSSKMAALLKKNNGMQRNLDKKTFTHTEIEFLKFASTDMTYKEICRKMNKSSSSIDNCRQLLFEKTGVCSRVGLAVYAIKNGIVSI